MKTLSIKLPWASLIAHGIKDIENRTWKTKFRGRIYIHASQSPVKEKFYCLNQEMKNLACQCETWNPVYFDDLQTAAIIGEVDIVDCVINHPSIWAEKTETSAGHVIDHIIYNRVLANPVLYDEPILNVKGKLSLWEFDGKETKGNG